MKKLLIITAATVGVTLASAATVYATGNHNYQNNYDKPYECKPKTSDVKLMSYEEGEQDKHKKHKKHWCKEKKPCEYNPELKAYDKRCVPPTPTPQPTPQPTPEPIPTPAPAPAPTPAPAVQASVSASVVDTAAEEQVPAFEGK